MTSDLYDQLADALSARGGAVPVRKCDEFFALLEELYAPEDAELALAMPMLPVTAQEVAAQMGTDAREVEPGLERMAGKGLVFSKKRGDATYYNLIVLLPGVFELQFMKGEVDDHARKLARLFEDYFNVTRRPVAPGTPVAQLVPFARVITVEREIPAGVEIHTFDRVSEYITQSDYIGVSVCYCRHHGELLGNPCTKPKDVCLAFGANARYLIERGFARQITREEARDVLERAEKAGLIHCSSNTSKRIDFICNCCDCHCGIVKSFKDAAVPSMAALSSFVVAVEAGECVACDACLERCQIEALSMSGDAIVADEARCVGCGLCVSACPTGALRLELREGIAEPPPNWVALNRAMIVSYTTKSD